MRMPFIALLLAAPVAAAQAQDSTKYQTQVKDSAQMTTSVTPTPLNDTTLLSRMHATNQMEIRLGQLAQRNGASATVKQYGARLVRDHSSADARVTALAKKLGITLMTRNAMDSAKHHGWDPAANRNQPMRTDPMRPDSMKMQHDSMGRMDHSRMDQGKDHTKNMQRFETLRGAEFDAAFAQEMVQGHQKMLTLLEVAQHQAQNTEVRTLITATLPTLREHLRMAQALVSGTSTSSGQ
jgi:putative membrane protein